MSTTTQPKTSVGAIFVFGCAILTGVFGVATVLFEEVPLAIGLTAAAITGSSGIVSAYLTMRPRRHEPSPPSGWPAPSGLPHGSPAGVPMTAGMMPPAPPTSPRAAGVRPFWLGATVVFGILSVAVAPSALLMIFTGLLAFRRRKAAAGVAVALTVVVVVCLALVVLAYVLDGPAAVPTTPYEICLAQGYDPASCAYYY
jgi:hypothetical protein